MTCTSTEPLAVPVGRLRAASIALALAFAVTGPAGVPAALAQGEPYLEYEVKAAFVYNLGKFVEWPPTSFASPEAEFVFCVLAPNPFRGSLRSVVRDKKVRGRGTRLRSHVPLPLRDTCHVLFVPAASDALAAAVIAAPRTVAGSPVLVIGESEGFYHAGGMVRLIVEEGGVRFDINTAAAESVGLRVSSQLLKLAREVDR